jgi:hypothetical protein
MNHSINTEQYGFVRMADSSGRVFCSHCLKILSTPRVPDMRAHQGSSYCSFRIATGVSAADKQRLGL